MITASSPRPCLRLSTDSVPAPLRPLLWLLRNVNSLLPSAVFRDFWDGPFGRDTMREAKHQACASGSSRRNCIHAWQAEKIGDSLLPSADFRHFWPDPDPDPDPEPIGCLRQMRHPQMSSSNQLTDRHNQLMNSLKPRAYRPCIFLTSPGIFTVRPSSPSVNMIWQARRL
jgi:hypothetical protein